MEIKELFLMAEGIANEKNISKEDVLQSLEEALAFATKKQNNIDAKIVLDRETGKFNTFRIWEIIADGKEFIDNEGEIEFNPELHIYVKDAGALKVGDFKEQEIDSIKFTRIASQTIKQIIIQKVREAERSALVKKFNSRVGEIISAIVKRSTKNAIYIDLGGIDGIIVRNELLPNEQFRKGDRIRAYIKEVKSNNNYGPQIILSRADNEMLTKLFAMEVPEIAEGVIEIMSCSRDPGFRAKIAVKTKDKRIDAIGSCIGIRGTRVQAVTNEFNGEKIDIILWDADFVKFAINAIAPAQTISIVVNENTKVMDLAFDDDQLAQAIGRNGQNIKLASKLVGWRLNAVSTADADNKQKKEDDKIAIKLAEQLGIKADVAGVLIAENFTSIDDIAESGIDKLVKIEGLSDDLAADLKERAVDAQLVQALKDADVNEALQVIDDIDNEVIDALIQADIITVNDLAELSVDELLDIYQLPKERASKIILAAREKEGWFN